MKKLIALIVALVLSLTFPLTSLAADHSNQLATTPDVQGRVAANAGVAWKGRPTLTVRAYIDGRSELILHRNTVHWHHFDFAAPGRHGGNNFPTYLNGKAWFPTWPDVPTAENRDCNCNSSTFVGVPRLPARSQTVDLTIVNARGSVSIVQQPNANNDYTLVLEFNDNPLGGPAWYEVTLTYSSCQGGQHQTEA